MDNPQFDVGQSYPGEAVVFTPDPPQRAPRGCWFYGCVTLAVLGALAVLAVAAAVYTVYYYVNKGINEYTATAPMPIPKVERPEEERKDLDARVAAFKKATDVGEAAELVLSADDLNTLINEQPQLKDKVYVSIEDSLIKAQMSMPLGEFGIRMLAGRFLNGNGSLTAKIEEGELDIRLRSIEVNGKTPPPNVMEELGSKNLLDTFRVDDPEFRKAIRKLDSLTVKDGKVTLKSHAKAKSAEGEAKPDPAKGDAPPVGADADKAKAETPTEKAAEPASAVTKQEEAPADPATTPKAEELKPETPKAEEPKAEPAAVPKAA